MTFRERTIKLISDAKNRIIELEDEWNRVNKDHTLAIKKHFRKREELIETEMLRLAHEIQEYENLMKLLRWE